MTVAHTPTNAAFFTASILDDADGDTIDSFLERTVYRTDPNRADTDGDGFSDPFEIAHALDPTTGCDAVATNAPGVVSYALADPFAFSDPDLVGETFFFRTLPFGRVNPYRQFFVTFPDSATAPLASGLSGVYSDSSGTTNSLSAAFTLGEDRLLLSSNEIASVAFAFTATLPSFSLLAPFSLVVYEPPVSFPELPCHENDDGTRLYVATDPTGISVRVDRSNRPTSLPVSEEELRANPFYDDPRFDWDWGYGFAPTVSLPGPGEYPLRSGDRLLVVAPAVAYGIPHVYSGTSVVTDSDGNPVAFKKTYPLDSVCLWEGWHEGTNAVGVSVCSCRPTLTIEPDLSAYACFSNTLVFSGETAEGRLFLDGREIWHGSDVHRGDSGGTGTGRSDILTDDGCGACSGCADGNCDALEGPSIGSIRFRIPLGVPREGQVSGFLWFESDDPFTPDTHSLKLISRSDADVEELELFGFRHVYCRDTHGRTVTLSNLVSGVSATVRDTVSGEIEHVWEITRVPDGMRFVKRSRLDNVMEDKTYARSGASWLETDNVSGLTVAETRTEDWQGGVFTVERTVTSAGRVAEHTVVVSALVGTDSGPVVRERERRVERADGTWAVSSADYTSDATRLGAGLLRFEGGDDRDWSWHGYDRDGRETFRLDQRDGSILPDPSSDYSLAALPACDAYATVLDYTPLTGDDDDVNDRDSVRTLSRYAVSNGAATLIGRTWTRYERGVFASACPRADAYPLVRTTSVRAASQASLIDDPANAVSSVYAYSSDSPLVPYCLRGRTLASTDEDGVTELTSYTLVSNVLRAVTRRVKGTAEAKTRRVVETDATYGNTLYEATQLTSNPSVEFETRRMTYDEKNRLRSTVYGDGSSETNAYSCCRLLWSVDRTGAKTLRSATTGTDRLYYAEEEVSLAELPPGTLSFTVPGLGYEEQGGGRAYFRVTKHFLDGLGRETNSVSFVSRDQGAAVDPDFEGNGQLYRTVETADYPFGFSDVTVSTDMRGAVTRTASSADASRDVTVVESFLSATDAVPYAVSSNVTWRGGATESTRVSCGKTVVSSSVTGYGSDGLEFAVSVTDSSDCGPVTNSLTVSDFLGRVLVTQTPTSCTSNVYDGASFRVIRSVDFLNGVETAYGYDGLGEEVSSSSRGVASWTLEDYEFRSNAWWRVSTSFRVADEETNGVSRMYTRLTGLSDACRSETVRLFDGETVSRETTSFDPSTKDLSSFSETESGVVESRSRFGRLWRTEGPAGTERTYLDHFGRPYAVKRSSSTDGEMRKWRVYERDSAGDLLGEGTYASSSELQERSHAYDALGRRVSTTDEAGSTVELAYDAEGRPVSESGDTYPVRKAYDSSGRLTGLETTRDGVGFDRTSWTYDPETGKCIGKTYADGSSLSYSFADDGLPVRTTFPGGQWIERVYDADCRAVGQIASDSHCAFGLELDGFGRTASASNNVSSYAYGYANCGIATNETATVSSDSVTLVRTADRYGRLTGLRVGTGPLTRVVYNPTNGVVAAVSNSDASVVYRYDRSLDQTGYTLTLANGVTFTRSLARHGYLRDEVTRVENASPVATNSLNYTYDVMHRPVTRGDDSFGYNRRGEVSNATISGQTESHIYDFIGNSLSATVTPASSSSSITNFYTANNLNQYLSIETLVSGASQTDSPTYGANGELIQARGFVYQYDALSRLTYAYNPQTGVSISNEYDHLSRRIRKIAPDGDHVYFYDSWNCVL